MEQLEFKHIAPYLPHGLKMVVTDDTMYYDGCYLKLEGESFDFDLVELPKLKTYGLNKDETWIDNVFTHSKPILRQLSEYRGEITRGEVERSLNCRPAVVYQIWELGSEARQLRDVTLEAYEVMCKNHIDFNQLIEKGLAIDINTL